MNQQRNDLLGAYLLSLLLLLAWNTVLPQAGQAQALSFEPLTAADGLSNNIVFSVLQDSRGYLWIGTAQGLNRYDGYGVTVYRHTPSDTTSLSYDGILALHEGRDGTLWVGTFGGGLNRFDPVAGTFTAYRHREGDATSLSHDEVTAVQEGRDGTLWVGTFGGGLNRFDPVAGTFTAYRHREGDATSLSHDEVTAVQEGRDGTLWVGTRGGGLNRLDAEAGTFTTYRHREGDATSLSEDHIRDLHEGRDGTLWVGTGGGLNRLDAKAGTFTAYRHLEGDATSLSHDQVTAVHEGHDGTLWVGTDGGLNRLDAEAGTFAAYRHREGDTTSLSHDGILALHEGRDGTLWVGTFGGGLNRLATEAGTFAAYRHREGDATSLSHDQVNALHEGRDGTLWLGTFGGGLNRLDAEAGTFTAYRHREGDATSLSDDWVLALHEGRDGTLWVGTLGGGLNRFDAETRTFTAYRHREGDATSLSHNEVTALEQGYDGTLWVGTEGGGLNRLDAEAGTFITYRHREGDATSLSDDHINALHEGRDGTLWVGTNGGLNRVDAEAGTFAAYRHREGDATSLSYDRVRVLHEGRDGTLWVGTANGLNRLRGATASEPDSFTRYTAKTSNFDGSAVFSMLEDDQGLLWLGLLNGKLARFNPDTGYFRYFGPREGIPISSFLPAAARTHQGTMYFGGVGGLVAFDPAQMQENTVPPLLALTELRLFNQPVEPGPDAPLARPLSQTEEVVLTHAQNDITLGFVGLHYAHPSGNRYDYRLEPYDGDWRGVTAERSATYTSLPPGRYRFEVRAANSDGVWSEEARALSILIRPPWWQTTWAYVLYGLLFLAGVFAAGQVQRRRLTRKERAKAEVREKDLRAEAAEATAKYHQSENLRRTQELEAARRLQRSMLPEAVPEHPTVELAAFMQTATEVGGDYYDFDLDDDSTLTLAIGDATGHGAQAGTMVTAAKSLFTHCAREPDLAAVLNRASATLKRIGMPKLYMAMALARVRDHTLELAGAGMPPALVYRAGTQQVEVMSLRGMPLGAPLAFRHQMTSAVLSPGDTVVFMSDGFPELFNAEGEMLGYERAETAFEGVASASPEEIIAHLAETCETWAKGRAQDDDVTFVVMKMKASTDARRGPQPG